MALNLSVKRMQRNVRAEVKASDTPSDVSLLFGTSKFRASVGKIVFLHEVRIEPGPSNYVFFATDQQGNKIVVSSDSYATKPSNGKFAEVLGVIAALPPLATMEREWKLSASVATSLRKEALYIRAVRIWPTSRATPANPATDSDF
jgi:hypothetical protein